MKTLARSCYAAAIMAQDGSDPTPAAPSRNAFRDGTLLSKQTDLTGFGYYKDG
jgi:hypothetical protein